MSLLILASCILGIIFLPSLMECLPTMFATLFKWKELENINSSAKLSHYRTQSCLMLILPFVLIAARYGLFAPATRFAALPCVGITAAAFAGFILLRIILGKIFHSKKMSRDSWTTAVKSPESFFCILTLLMAASSAVFQITSCPDSVARKILLWEIGALYLLCIIRKTQIFSHYRGGFSGFLYLCTLEIIPSGLLIAADQIL